MKDYKSNFDNALEYGLSKASMVWWKIIIMGILGSVYVALAYSGYIKIVASLTPDIDKAVGYNIKPSGTGLFLGSAIFPVGLIMIVFLGGSLFTSDNLSAIGWFAKKTKFSTISRKWILIFIANTIGGILIAYLMRLSNAYTENDQKVIAWLIHKKIDSNFLAVLGSAALSNILVAGTVWASLATTQSIGKVFIIWFPITLFAITGFHHVVANIIVFFFGIAYDGSLGSMSEMIKSGDNYHWFGRAIWNNIIPAFIGNWLTGALFLPASYYLLVKYKPKVFGAISLKNSNKSRTDQTLTDEIQKELKAEIVHAQQEVVLNKEQEKEQLKEHQKQDLVQPQTINKTTVKTKNNKTLKKPVLADKKDLSNHKSKPKTKKTTKKTD